MLYYKYRSPSEVSLKELLYSEIYFSSAEECNDPFDSRAHFSFPPDADKWARLLELAWRPLSEVNLTSIIAAAVKEITARGELSFQEALTIDLVTLSGLGTGALTTRLLTDMLRSTLTLYSPRARYFSSFSRRHDEPLMWSHYGDKHRGFCLIFRALDNALHQSQRHLKKSFRFNPTGGLAPSMSCHVPSSFKFEPIIYSRRAVPKNAFNCFPEYVSGPLKGEKQRLKLVASMESDYLQKQINWKYEEEVRLTLPAPIPWLFGEHIDYTAQQRLFHYEATQLVGVIFGARTSEEVKKRILEIVDVRQNWISQGAEHKHIVFDFVIFQAELTSLERSLRILPLSVRGLTKETKFGQGDFEERFSRWRLGWGFEFEGNRCSKVCVGASEGQ